jgi:hypothetical protein
VTDYSEGLYEISKALCLKNPEAQAHGALGGEYGYGQNFKNEVFEMRPFWWGDCTCGFEARNNEWIEAINHAPECYQTRIQESCFIPGSDYETKEGHDWGECACEEELCKEMGLTYPEGSRIHCTCEYKPAHKKWLETNDHSKHCALILPNFFHYESGLEISWYKYIGRGMEANMELSYLEWTKIVEECLCTINGTLSTFVPEMGEVSPEGQENERQEAMARYLDLSAMIREEEEKFLAKHWANDLLDSPHALIAVIETKIARAELAERRRIIDLIRPLGCEGNGVEHDCNVPLKDYTANQIINLIEGLQEEEDITFTWPLGDDLDCETCGPTYNEVGIELWDDEKGVWQLYIRVGCYEGDSVLSNDPEWEKKSAEVVEQATWYSEFGDDEVEELRDKLALIKGEKE